MEGFVYILEMKNGRYYVGSTKDLKRRILEHERGNVSSIRNNRPLELLYFRRFDTYEKAHKKEMNLKKQRSRKSVERFMEGK